MAQIVKSLVFSLLVVALLLAMVPAVPTMGQSTDTMPSQTPTSRSSVPAAQPVDVWDPQAKQIIRICNPNEIPCVVNGVVVGCCVIGTTCSCAADCYCAR